MTALDVWLNGQRAGELTATRRGGAAFAFDPAFAAARIGSPVLSCALPVQENPFDGERTRNWFTGLLPEDRQLDEVRRRFALQSANYFDILRQIGWECAGAVVVGREGERPQPGTLIPVDDVQLAERLAALPAHPFDGDEVMRVSLGGYQAKMLVSRHAGGWFLPAGGAISTHILKPQPFTSFPGIIAAEAWAMSVAARVTSTARTELLGLESAPVTLVVERFDRAEVDGEIVRLHQEDACQGLGLPPERKYASGQSETRADPSFVAIARILERYAVDPRTELTRLAEQMTVNVALGNTDAHAKNYGIVHTDGGTVSLSPMYDVVPATVVNPSVREMGLRIDGTLRIDRVTGAKLIAEARSWGLGRALARDAVVGALEKLADVMPETRAVHPEPDPRLAETAVATVHDLLITTED